METLSEIFYKNKQKLSQETQEKLQRFFNKKEIVEANLRFEWLYNFGQQNIQDQNKELEKLGIGIKIAQDNLRKGLLELGEALTRKDNQSKHIEALSTAIVETLIMFNAALPCCKEKTSKFVTIVMGYAQMRRTVVVCHNNIGCYEKSLELCEKEKTVVSFVFAHGVNTNSFIDDVEILNDKKKSIDNYKSILNNLH